MSKTRKQPPVRSPIVGYCHLCERNVRLLYDNDGPGWYCSVCGAWTAKPEERLK